MNAPGTVVVLGVDWADPATPVLRTASDAGTVTSPLVGDWCFKVIDGPTFCCGWFDLTGDTPRHVACADTATTERGTQCRRCQYSEGFVTAHQAHRGATELADNVRDYLAQPHYLYLDVFAEGSIKVGTVANSRLDVRLAEQGAVAARYLTRSADGAAARRLEEAVSTQLGLAQSVSSKRKLSALSSTVDVENLTRRLDQRVADIGPLLHELAGPGDEVLDQPRPWALPHVAVDAFAAAPLALYPSRFTEGTHSLHVRASTGQVVVFVATDEPDAPLYAATITSLRGRQIELGDYRSDVAPTQAALF